METVDRISREKEETFRISVRELVVPLFRRKRLLTGTFLSLLTLSVLAALLIPVPYKAHMSVLVQRDRLDPLVSTGPTTQVLNGAQSVSEEETNSEVDLLTSHDVLEKVVVASGLDNPKSPSWMQELPKPVLDLLHSSQTQADRQERAVRKLAKKLNVETGTTKSNVIDVTYKSSDPSEAYAVIKALATFYIEKHIEVHNPYGSAKFFADEMKKYKGALDASEQQLRDFSKDEGLSAPDIERTDLAQDVANAIGELHTAQQMAAADAAHIRNDGDQLKSTPERATTLQQSMPADKLLQDLHEELVAAQAKRAQLTMKYDSDYPLVREADHEIAQIQSAIVSAEKTTYQSATTDKDATYELIREDLAKTKADESAQRASIASLQNAIKNLQSQMVSLDQKALQLHDLQRDSKVNEDNYLLFQSKWQQAQASNALNQTRIGNVAIADSPEVPALPMYSLSMLLAIAFIGSLFLSVIAAYAVDYFDPSFHTPAQVAEVLEIPVVVAVHKRA